MTQRRRFCKMPLYAPVLFICMLGRGPLAWSAGEGASANSEYGVIFSNLLPNQIKGVTEITPFWGALGAWQLTTPPGMFELSVNFAKASGVEDAFLSAGYRYESAFANGVVGFVDVGATANYYNTVFNSERELVGGGYVGVGGLALIVGPIWVRGAIAFQVSPGASLLLNLAFLYRR